jgi:phage-related baseplate assembly protein
LRDFLEIDPELIQEAAIEAFEAEVGEKLYAGDERRILLNTMSGLLTVALGKLNALINMDFPQYAIGEYLDELGTARGVTRIPAQAALVTMQFTLSAVQGTPTLIPAGTRVTPDSSHFFATTEDLTIPAGQLTGSVTAQATGTGSGYNNFPINSIVVQVDLVPLVQGVTNTDASQGGAEIESDESYRERIMLSMASYSAAGSELSYIFWAKGADSTIEDVSVVSPGAGQVTVTVLLENGGIPGQPLLDKVAFALSPRTVRPLSDAVTVQAPTVQNYSITLTYYIEADRQPEEAMIQAAVQDAIENFVVWQGAALGRHVNPNVLIQKLMNAGAARVTVTNPAFASLTPNKIAVLSGTPSVTYGGLI